MWCQCARPSNTCFFESTCQTASRSVQPFFLHSYSRVPIRYNGPRRLFSPRGSLDQPHSVSQTASRLVQSFLDRSEQVIPYNGPPFPSSKLSLCRGYGPTSNTWIAGLTGLYNPNSISITPASFAGLTTNRQTTLFCF